MAAQDSLRGTGGGAVAIRCRGRRRASRRACTRPRATTPARRCTACAAGAARSRVPWRRLDRRSTC